MARLVVQAEWHTTVLGQLLVVSVVGAGDGVPRTGLTAAQFAIAELAHDTEAVWTARSVAQMIEGPDGIYTLALAPPLEPDAVADGSVLAIVVRGPVATGWAEDRGQTLVSGRLPGDPAGGSSRSWEYSRARRRLP
jgi:hypothetical protein